MTHPLQPQIIKCVGGKNFDGSFLRWAAGKPMGTRLTFLVSKAKYTQRKFESIFEPMSFKIELDIKLYCS